MSLVWAKWRGSSAAVTLDGSISPPPKAVRTTPPATSLRPRYHESMPGPVEMAAHTSSGVASTTASWGSSNSRPTSALLLHRGVHGDDEPVVAAARGLLV